MITCVECSGIGQYIDTEVKTIQCEFCSGVGEVTPLDLPPEQLTMRQLMNWYLLPSIQTYKYSTRGVFNADPRLEFVEFVEFSNYKNEQQAECDTTLMHSSPHYTKPPQASPYTTRLEWKSTNRYYLFNTSSLPAIIDLVNRVVPVVWTFPDSSTMQIHGCVSRVELPNYYRPYLQPNNLGYLGVAIIRIDYYGVIEYSPVNLSPHFVIKL